MDINTSLSKLTAYAYKNKLIEKSDIPFCFNSLLAALSLKGGGYTEYKGALPKYPSEILSEISGWAVKNGLLEGNISALRENFETKIISIFAKRPSDYIEEFCTYMMAEGADKALKWMYQSEQCLDYIKTERVAKNLSWKTQTPYGALDITINLSKPEKDPKEIAKLAAMSKTPSGAGDKDEKYPKCLLCRENEGYAGTLTHPARQNIRLIPLNLQKEKWYFQFSPYVYYNEHCIVLRAEHEPMQITSKTFKRLYDFLTIFPSYFIGSNADLPIVGGSILNHDHYQGGRYVFPMQRAKDILTFKIKKYASVKCSVINWPLSVIRLTGRPEQVLKAAEHIFKKWVNYSDESVDIIPYTGKVRHNTVTPIARMQGKYLQMDLALRNNRTTASLPYGIFHSREEYHHIKRENIGLIEVLGMAILPGRLKAELGALAKYLVKGDLAAIKKDTDTLKHYDWACELAKKHKFTRANAEKILFNETGIVFSEVLECCGVFKADDAGQKALKRFIDLVK
ncbi:UDPglucose--hexose-1-phosphate uridylyltransferase [Parelusimicrobium proximum]|uniref:UDP-glucose--hexose-1-phosphate uridylyltransferase n=1 Tax=Parelusimicrobium proximum TaxID=3228953 RepID=UPI003D17A944